MPVKANKHDSGLLLLEVLISIAIVASVLIVVNRAFSTSLRAVRLAGNYLFANYILEDKAFDIRVQKSFADINFSDTVEANQRQFFCETNIAQPKEAGSDDTEPLPIRQADLSVNWDSANTASRVNVSTYVWEKEQG